MDWENVFAEIILVVARVICVVCVPYLANLLKEKIHNDAICKYVDKAQNVVTQCVGYVNQTYVDALKKEGKFDKTCQREAFNMSKAYVLSLLDDAAKGAITEAFGDFELWVDSRIESSVRDCSEHVLEGVLVADDD